MTPAATCRTLAPILLGVVIGAHPGCAKKVRPPETVPEAIEGLSDSRPEARVLAANAFMGSPDPDRLVSEALVEMLLDPDPTVRSAAAATLGHLHPPATWSIPQLGRAMEDPDEQVVASAAGTLVRFGMESMATLQVLTQSRSPVTRAYAQRALYAIRTGRGMSMRVPGRRPGSGPSVGRMVVRCVAHPHGATKMNVKDLLNYNVQLSHGITKAYLDDIADDEMLVRAVPGSNHLAWQLGHLIASERSLLAAIGADVPDLPDGFAEKHGKDNIDSDDPGDFLTKDEYFALMERMHQAAAGAIEKTDEAGLDVPTPEDLRNFFPTVGSILLMAGSHEMMHAGQIAAIRRKLGKPVVI